MDISSVLPMFSRLTKIALRGTMGPFIFAFYRRQYGSTIIETLDIAPGHRAPHMDSSNPPFNYNRRDGGQMTNLLDSGTNPLCNTFHSGNTLRGQQKCKRLWEILLLLGVLRLRTDKSPRLLVSIDAKETFGIFCGREGWFWPKSAAGPRTVMSGCFFNPVHQHFDARTGIRMAMANTLPGPTLFFCWPSSCLFKQHGHAPLVSPFSYYRFHCTNATNMV